LEILPGGLIVADVGLKIPRKSSPEMEEIAREIARNPQKGLAAFTA
jgi:hypothetical protein